jgi:hypothetical protein
MDGQSIFPGEQMVLTQVNNIRALCSLLRRTLRAALIMRNAMQM